MLCRESRRQGGEERVERGLLEPARPVGNGGAVFQAVLLHINNSAAEQLVPATVSNL